MFLHKFTNNKGEFSIFWIIIYTFVIILVIIPLITTYLDKMVCKIIAKDTKDIVYDSICSTYISLNISKGSEKDINFNNEFKKVFKKYLAKNMKLNDDLTPKMNSYFEHPIKILELKYEDQSRKHAKVKILLPLKPNFFRQRLLELMGKDWIGYEVIYKISLPIDY